MYQANEKVNICLRGSWTAAPETKISSRMLPSRTGRVGGQSNLARLALWLSGFSHLLAKVGQETHKGTGSATKWATWRTTTKTKQNNLLFVMFFFSLVFLFFLCCCFSPRLLLGSLLLPASAAICFEWGRRALNGSLVSWIWGRCGVKGSKTNQVNNQQSIHTRTHTYTRTYRHWGRHSVKVNVTAHLIARTARIQRSRLPTMFTPATRPPARQPARKVDKRNFLLRALTWLFGPDVSGEACSRSSK